MGISCWFTNPADPVIPLALSSHAINILALKMWQVHTVDLPPMNQDPDFLYEQSLPSWQ